MRRLHDLLSEDNRITIQPQEEDNDFMSPQWTLPTTKPLERVDETDHETDGTITPSAYSMFSSPPLSSATHKAIFSELPTTPLFSTNQAFDKTVTAVAHLNQSKYIQPSPARVTVAESPDLVERWRLQRRSMHTDNAAGDNEGNESMYGYNCEGNYNDETGNETIEFSVATGPTVVAQGPRFFQTDSRDGKQESRSSHTSSSSSKIDEQMIVENADEDDANGTNQFSQAPGFTVVGLGSGAPHTKGKCEGGYVFAGFEGTSLNEGDRLSLSLGKLELIDDQNKKATFSLDATKALESNWALDRYMSSNLLPGGLSRHVLVNNTSPLSAAATELTMDEAIQNTALGSPSFDRGNPNGDESVYAEASEAETPILDRYRLEPDDNSIGVKVVPNERRLGRGAVKLLSSEKTTLKTIQPIQEDQPLESPQNASDRRRTGITYRKTPHPKAKHGMSKAKQGMSLVEENESLNTTSEKSEWDRREERIPLRDIDPAQIRTPAGKFKSSQSISENLEPLSRTPLTSAWISKHMSPAEISQLMESMELPESQTSPLENNDITTRREESGQQYDFRIQAVTLDEYQSAARVVQMQVSADEVNESIDVLNLWMYNLDKTQFSEEEACAQLQQRFSLRKSKSLLMSLCHWRRMVVRLNNGRKEFHIRSESIAGSNGDVIAH
jgi:hypothetical protein